MRHRSRETIKFPDDDSVKLMQACVRHKPVEFWPADSGTGNPQIHIFSGELPPTVPNEFLELPCLQGDILTVIARTNSRVQRDSDGSRVRHFSASIRHSVWGPAIFFRENP